MNLTVYIKYKIDFDSSFDSFVVASIEFVARARTITNYDQLELKNLNLLITLEKPMDERILKSQQTVSYVIFHML